MEKPRDYFAHAQEMKSRLDSVSPSLCLAKWLQVSLHLPTGLTQSCYHPPTHKIPLDEIKNNPSALHNTKEKKLQRKQMKEGIRPPGCEYCWKIEDGPSGFLSDRIVRSNESWASPHFEEVVQQPFDYNVNPRYLEVNFNQACNFKCAYCSPHLSTSWESEIESYGPYPTLVPHNDTNYLRSQGLMPIAKSDDNPYENAFWEWWPKLYQDIKVFRMTGGEPLIDKNTFRVLDWIIGNPRPSLELAITSNMCPPEKLMDQFITKMKIIMESKMIESFSLFASIDTWGRQAEYIRYGLDFNVFWKNIERYLEEVPHGMVTFIVTMNCLSLPNLKKLIEGMLELQKKYNVLRHRRVLIDTPFLRDPKWMSLQILPPEYHSYFDETLRFMENHRVEGSDMYGFKDLWIGVLRRTEEWMKAGMPEPELTKARVNFYRFFSEYDRRRGTDFCETFPEYQHFWELCQELSHKHS